MCHAFWHLLQHVPVLGDLSIFYSKQTVNRDRVQRPKDKSGRQIMAGYKDGKLSQSHLEPDGQSFALAGLI